MDRLQQAIKYGDARVESARAHDPILTADLMSVKLPSMRLSQRLRARLIVEIAIAFVGIVLFVSALLANQRWLDHHFLPSFYTPRSRYVLIESIVRIIIALIGAVLALVVRRPLGKFIACHPARALQISLAVLLAFPATEFVLRVRHRRVAMAEEYPAEVEPSRQLDARLGWVFVPSRTGHQTVGGRIVDYAIDSAGYRVRGVDEPVDLDRPTIVFTGESIMVGERLTWDESIPAQTGAILGLQSANIAVSGFANDQAYLRLQAELSRFRRPVAVVTLFAPLLFDRNLNDDRPHLGPGLGERHPGMDRHLEREPPAVHLDQDRRRDLELTRRLPRQSRNGPSHRRARLTSGISGAEH